MRESRLYGSVRGARCKSRAYRYQRLLLHLLTAGCGRFCCKRPPIGASGIGVRTSTVDGSGPVNTSNATRLPYATDAETNGGGGPIASLANLRRFCAIAAMMNSN